MDNKLVEKIVAEHNPDPDLKYDAKQILNVAEGTLKHATLSTDESVSTGALAHDEQVEYLSNYMNPDDLSFEIHRITSVISHHSDSDEDVHSTAFAIFDLLTKYEWDAKLVLNLAAFSLIYGNFWLHANMDSTNQLSRLLASLNQVPSVSTPRHHQLEALNELVKVILEVARCVIGFKILPAQYIAKDSSAYNIASNHIPIAVYWSVRGIMVCATQITSLTKFGFGFMQSTAEAWELSTLTHRLKSILGTSKKEPG